MFDSFRDQWTPVAFGRALRDRPLQRTVAGTRVALFRDARGVARALVDRCPHRGVALSLGNVVDGCLECPFHAWRFDGSGACVEVPLNPMSDEKRARLAATALPLVEAAGVLWLFTGLTAVGEPPVPEASLRDDVVKYEVSQMWATHWTRAMENMLDSPHVPYLHRRTIGRFVRPKIKAGSRMDVRIEPTPRGFRSTAPIDGDATDGAWIEWLRPNGMTLNIPVPNALWRIHAFCVPVDDTHTEMMVFSARSFLRWLPSFVMDRTNKKILDEDKAVLESSLPVHVPDAGREVSVASDRATLTFRRWYLHTFGPAVSEGEARNTTDAGEGDDVRSLAAE